MRFYVDAVHTTPVDWSRTHLKHHSASSYYYKQCSEFSQKVMLALSLSVYVSLVIRKCPHTHTHRPISGRRPQVPPRNLTSSRRKHSSIDKMIFRGEAGKYRTHARVLPTGTATTAKRESARVESRNGQRFDYCLVCLAAENGSNFLTFTVNAAERIKP